MLVGALACNNVHLPLLLLLTWRLRLVPMGRRLLTHTAYYRLLLLLTLLLILHAWQYDVWRPFLLCCGR